MKAQICNVLLIVGALFLSSCIHENPIFTEEFIPTDPSLAGVWVTDENGDPRSSQYAVLVPMDEKRYVLHHPARSQDSFYYEAHALKRQERTLLQLRVLSTFKGGVAELDSKRFTLLWVQPQADGRLLVRPANGKGSLVRMTPAEARKALEDPASNWDAFFTEGDYYRRLK